MQKHFSLILLLAGAADFSSVKAQDKSGGREGLVKLPTMGGTVAAENAAFNLENNRGAVSYRLPLPSLPSRAGFAPSAALTYSQFQSDPNQGFGIGWALDLPAIQLSLETGTPQGSRNFTRDVYRFRGEKLIVVRTEGTDTHFRLESNSDATQIIFHSQPYSIAHARGLAHPPVRPPEPWPLRPEQVGFQSGFEVIYPDGRRQLFDTSLSSAEGQGDTIVRMPLSHEVAPTGETIAYRYSKEKGRSLLREIWFADGFSRYRLERTAEQTPRASYAYGYPQESTNLYTRLVAEFQEKTMNQWCFAYQGRSATDAKKTIVKTHPSCQERADKDLGQKLGRSHLNVLDQLSSLYRFGDDAALVESTLEEPSITFTYSDWGADGLKNRSLVYSVGSQLQSFSKNNFELIDVDMDGLVDIISQGDNGVSVLYGTGDVDKPYRNASLKTWTLNRQNVSVKPKLLEAKFQTADINGDSFIDVLEYSDGRWHVYLGQGKQGGFLYGGVLTAFDFSPEEIQSGYVRLADINLDGRTDFLRLKTLSSGKVNWALILNQTPRPVDGKWSFQFATFESPYVGTKPGADTLGDLDSQRLVDFNGDQLPDHVEFLADSLGFCLYPNQGLNGARIQSQSRFFGVENGHAKCNKTGLLIALQGEGVTADLLKKSWFGDFNGDGLVDIASLGASKDTMNLWLGLGSGAFGESQKLTLNKKISGTDELGRISRVADVDSDGQREILIFQESSNLEDQVLTIDFNRKGENHFVKPQLLTTIKLATGLRYDVRYALSTDEYIRNKTLFKETASTIDPNPVHFPVVLAKQILTSDDRQEPKLHNIQASEFFYFNPSFNPDDKDFKGFERIVRVQYGDEFADHPTEQSRYVDEIYHNRDIRLAGRMRQQMTYSAKPSPELLRMARETLNLNGEQADLHSLLAQTRRQILPTPDQLLVSRSWTWAVEEIKNGAAYVRLNQKSETTHKGDLAKTVTTHFQNFDEFNLPALSRTDSSAMQAPYQVTIPAFSKVEKFDYTAARQELAEQQIVDKPSQQIIEVNGQKQQQKNWEYNEAGQVASERQALLSGVKDVPAVLMKLPNAAFNDSHSLNYDYDAYGNRTAERDAEGTIERLIYDEQGILPIRSIQDLAEQKLEAVTVLDYKDDKPALLEAYTTAQGLTVTFSYDSLNRRVRAVSSQGGEQEYRYRWGQKGEPTLILSSIKRYRPGEGLPGEDGWIQRLQAHNADGTLLAELENAAEDGVRILKYNVYNRNKHVVLEWTPYLLPGSSLDQVFSQGVIPEPKEDAGVRKTYDANGRLLRQTLPTGKTIEFEYFPWGAVEKNTYPRAINDGTPSAELNHVNLSIISGPLGDLARVEESVEAKDWIKTEVERDGSGQIQSLKLDGEGEPRRFAHNSRGLLEAEWIPGLKTIFYAYDKRGRRIAELTIGNQNEKRFIVHQYDSRDRLVQTHANGRLQHEFAYDIYPAGTKPFFGPLAFVDKPLGLQILSKSYDPNQLYDQQETTVYDLSAQDIGHEVQIGKQKFQDTFERALDGTIRRTRNPANVVSTYRLNNASEIETVTVDHVDVGGEQVIVAGTKLNAKKQLARVDYREGAYTTIDYEPKTLQMKHIQSFFNRDGKSQILQDLTMKYDGDNKILSIDDAIQEAPHGHVNRSGVFDYDWRGQLTLSQRFGEILSYAYTKLGTFLKNDEVKKAAVDRSEAQRYCQTEAKGWNTKSSQHCIEKTAALMEAYLVQFSKSADAKKLNEYREFVDQQGIFKVMKLMVFEKDYEESFQNGAQLDIRKAYLRYLAKNSNRDPAIFLAALSIRQGSMESIEDLDILISLLEQGHTKEEIELMLGVSDNATVIAASLLLL